MLAVFLVLTVILFIIRKTRRTIYVPAMAIAALIACIFHIGYTYLAVIPVEDRFTGEEYEVKAVLLEEPYRSYGKNYYQLRTMSVDEEDVNCKLLLKLPHPIDADIDDVLTFRSEINIMDNNYYRAKGFYIVSDSYGIEVDVHETEKHSLYYRAVQLRRWMRQALDRTLPEDCAALCRAVLIGDKYALDLSVRENFRYAGASYFIVVSGMHFAVLYLLLDKLLKQFHVRILRLVIPLMFIGAYMAITGFQPSVIRSGIMISFIVLGNFIRRQTYSPNHLGIAGIVMPCFLSPYGAGDISLILSFYATLSILLWATPIAKKLCYTDEFGNIPQFHFGVWLHKRIEKIKERKNNKNVSKEPFDFLMFRHKLRNTFCSVLAVSLAANILVFPISTVIFREFSTVTLLSAVLLYFEIYLILILSLFVCILYWLGPLKYVAMVIALPLTLLCRLVLWIVEALGNLPFAHIRIGNTYFYIWLAVTVVLGAVVILYRNQYRYLRLAVFCSAVVLLGGILTHTILESQVLELEVYACGKGLCVGLNNRGNLHILRLDANSKYLYGIMDDLSCRYSGAETVLCLGDKELKRSQLYRDDEFAISRTLLYDNEEYETDDNIIAFGSDSVFALDDSVTLSVITSGDTLIPYVDAEDKQVLIIPDGCMIEDIPQELRQADVIVMTKAISGTEQLRCDSLIISDDYDDALLTATVMQGCYREVYITGEENVTYRLR
ncbi:MAG: ComEC/Rec2 family competence protein [Ruminococcus sp.]|nr:ComEC/Rec2 family competence protein [Ruminococcus sp.]